MQRNVRHQGGSDGRFTAQLSSGQLVIAICVSLFVMLACFLLGVLAGKYDNTLTDAVASAAAAIQGDVSKAEETTPKEPERPRTGQQSPRPIEEDSTALAMRRPPMDRTAAPPPAEIPRRVELAPLPASPQPASAPARAATPPEAADAPGFEETQPPQVAHAAPSPIIENPPIPVRESPPAAAPAPSPAPVAAEPPAALEPISAPAPQAPATPAAAAPPALQPSAPAGSYGVQIISLWGENRAERARGVQQSLQAKHKLPSTVLIQQNGDRYVVVVTGFRTQEEATRARDKIRRETEYTDCFVRNL